MKHDDLMFMLDNFGRLYHTYFGFDCPPEIYVSNKEQKRQEFWGNFAEEEIEKGDEICYILCTDVIKDEAQAATPYKEVILTLPTGYWEKKRLPEDGVMWYDKTSKWWKEVEESKEHLSFLKSRGYIKVVDPLQKVVIESSQKGNTITIEDILFAARALAADDTRKVADGGFKVVSYVDGVLALEPNTDNWSTKIP